jgi:hypothetical protein
MVPAYIHSHWHTFGYIRHICELYYINLESFTVSIELIMKCIPLKSSDGEQEERKSLSKCIVTI